MYDKLLCYYILMLFSGGMLLSVLVQIPARVMNRHQHQQSPVLTTSTTKTTKTSETLDDEQYTKFVSKISRRNADDFKTETLQVMNEHIREMLKRRNKLDEEIQLEQEYKAFLAQRLAYAVELAKFVDELEKRFIALCEENKSTEADYMKRFPNEVRLFAANRTCSSFS